MRPVAEGADDGAGLVNQRLTAANQVPGGEVALNAAVHLHMARRPFRGDRLIKGDAIRARGPREPGIARPGPARKGDDRNAGVTLFECGDDLPRRGNGIAGEIRRGQRPGPTVKQLYHLGPGVNLGREVFNGGTGQAVNQAVESALGASSFSRWAGA